MDPLPHLEQVSQVSPYVTRILGQNPGKFTLQGTNSYLVHHPLSPELVLIDTTGPSSADPLPASSISAYTAHLLAALAGHPAQPARVSDILLTHWHGDHVTALPDVLDAIELAGAGAGQRVLPTRVWKMPCRAFVSAAEDDAWASEAQKDAEIERSLAPALAAGRVQPAAGGQGALSPLAAGQRFSLGAPASADDAVQLEVVHTPGHTSDSVCLVLRRSAPSSSSSGAPPPLALFTADTILGHGSSIFASLSAYMSSLSSLLAVLPSCADEAVPLYPGHGAPAPCARTKVTEYAAHREAREAQVVQALQAQTTGAEPLTAEALTEKIYGPSLPAPLHRAAAHSLLLHLAKLASEGRVVRVRVPDAQEGEGEGKGKSGWGDGWRWGEDEADEAVDDEGSAVGRL